MGLIYPKQRGSTVTPYHFYKERVDNLSEYGIYVNVIKGNNKTNDGHLLYFGECSICGRIVEKRLIDFKRCNTNCCHNNRSYSIKNNRIKSIYQGIISRCYNKNNKDYRFYGGKGIGVYNIWMDSPEKFEKWAIKHGYEETLTIDRIDGSKNYCPKNCRWITNSENSRDKISTRYIDVNGNHLSGRQWADKINVSTNFINKYFRNNGKEATVEYIKGKLE